MRKLMIAVIAIAAGASAGWAQGSQGAQGSQPPGRPETPRAAPAAGAGMAPVGHRQPRRTEVPQIGETVDRSPEDRALDRKIKSICRGC